MRSICLIAWFAPCGGNSITLREVPWTRTLCRHGAADARRNGLIACSRTHPLAPLDFRPVHMTSHEGHTLLIQTTLSWCNRHARATSTRAFMEKITKRAASQSSFDVQVMADYTPSGWSSIDVLSSHTRTCSSDNYQSDMYRKLPKILAGALPLAGRAKIANEGWPALSC